MNARVDLPLHELAAAVSDSKRLGKAERTGADMLGLLMCRAMPNLSRADLELLLEASGEAELVAERAAVVAEGIACLVMADSGESSPRMGNFQDGADVADLLLHFADTFKTLASFARVGADAASLLGERGGAA